MAKRIILAGIVGGIVFFVWQSVAHLVSPLGDMGIKGITNEAAVIAALGQNIAEPGFYFFPSGGRTSGMSPEQRKKAVQKMQDMYRSGPHGILIFDPHGAEVMTAKQLLIQLGADILTLLLAAWLLAQAAGGAGYGKRLLFVTALGLIPTLAEGLSYWNWYGFPVSYTLAQLTVFAVGFGLAGLVLAKLVKPRA